MNLKYDSSKNVNQTGVEEWLTQDFFDEHQAHQEMPVSSFSLRSWTDLTFKEDGYNFAFVRPQNYEGFTYKRHENVFIILSKNYEPTFKTNEQGIQSLTYSLTIEALCPFGIHVERKNIFSLYMPRKFFYDNWNGSNVPIEVPLNAFLYVSNAEPVTQIDMLGYDELQGYEGWYKVTLKTFDTLPELQNLKLKLFMVPTINSNFDIELIKKITFGFKPSSLISAINISQHESAELYKPWDDLGTTELNRKKLIPVIVNTLKNNENYDSYYFWSLDANNNPNMNEVLHNTNASDQAFQLKNFLGPSELASEVEQTIFKLLENTRLFQSGFAGFTDEEKATWFLNNGNITNLQDLNDWIVRKMLSKLELLEERDLYIKFKQVILMLSSHIKSSYAFKGGLTDEHKAAQYLYLIAFYEKNDFKLYTASSLLSLSTKVTRGKPLSKRNREIIEMLGKEINPNYVFEETEWTSEKIDFSFSIAQTAFFNNGTFSFLNSCLSFPINNWNEEPQNISQNPLDFNNLSKTFNYVYFLPLEAEKIKNLTGKLKETKTIESPTEVRRIVITKKDKVQPTAEEVKRLLASGDVPIKEEELKKYAFFVRRVRIQPWYLLSYKTTYWLKICFFSNC
ncbi:hypothetical protein [Mycoplasmopsis pullorum]|uniref:Uncharacterized protein n=1 Tax=Mycoplasmopsis pullorum TaxID=48003 RepID=A0A1L4FSB5_9BACT|nr:hypothetical protein [Mycoplasmopsis pullorum]APJ38507.1 hypothetical protein BLA55_02455 [Mycoplasmopsis pullorum]